MSSPFSLAAVRLLRELDIVAWKIASGEVGNRQLLDAVLEDHRPVILSSGMSGWAELDAAAALVRSKNVGLALMQCTTEYPSSPESIGLNVIGEMRTRYGCPVGLSDHSGAIYAPLAAVALGASCIEVHVAFHKSMFGPDVSASLMPDALTLLCTGVKMIHQMLSHPMEKDRQAAGTEPLRKIFSRSIVLDRAVTAGINLELGMLSFRKPGTGIPPAQIDRVVGRIVRTALPANHIIQFDDLL